MKSHSFFIAFFIVHLSGCLDQIDCAEISSFGDQVACADAFPDWIYTIWGYQQSCSEYEYKVNSDNSVFYYFRSDYETCELGHLECKDERIAIRFPRGGDGDNDIVSYIIRNNDEYFLVFEEKINNRCFKRELQQRAICGCGSIPFSCYDCECDWVGDDYCKKLLPTISTDGGFPDT